MKIIKKCLYLFLTAVMVAGTLTMTAGAAGISATPTTSEIQLNETAIAIEGYVIDGNNYFKLRDIALALTGTLKRFSVDWDSGSNSIKLTRAQPYIAIGGELTVSGNAAAKQAIPTASKVYVNDALVSIKGYTIGQNNFFKLRDLGEALDFGVTYDGPTNTVKIDSRAGYYAANILAILEGAYYRPSTGRVSYSSVDIGRISVDQYGRTSYQINATGVTTDSALLLLKNVIGVFISSPEKVIDALNAIRLGGTTQIEADGKTVDCMYLGSTQTIKIKW